LSEPELNFHLKTSYELMASGSLTVDAEVRFFLTDPALPVPLIYQGGYSTRRAHVEKFEVLSELAPYGEDLLAWTKSVR